MREPARLAVAAVVAAGVAVLGPAMAGSPDEGQSFGTIERGRYLTDVGDCAACHTPPGGKPFAGGRAIETPFGTILAPNITPDRDTGIGAWSDAEFVGALRRGTGRGGELIYPAMPYVYMTKMTDADALAIRAYLATIGPVRNHVVSNQLPFPFSVRQGLRVWDALYFHEGTFTPDPAKSPEWNRGAYIVTGPGHCGACHTPKDGLGGDDAAAPLGGHNLQGWFAPDITDGARRGLGAWSTDDVVSYLGTGHNRFAAAAGPMAEVVTLSTSRLRPDDLKAVATFLKDGPGRREPAAAERVDASSPVMSAGAAIYRDACSACHTPDGSGIPGLFPKLRGSPAVQSRDPASVIRVVLRGVRSVATAAAPTGPAMPSFDWQLNDDQVAAVTTYVRNAWGNAAPAVAASTVTAARAALAKRND